MFEPRGGGTAKGRSMLPARPARIGVDGAYYKTITGRTADVRTSRGTHSFSVRTVDTSDNRSYQEGATIRVR